MKLLIVVCIALMIEAVYSTHSTICVCGSCGVITSETDTKIQSQSNYGSDNCSYQIDPLTVDKCAQVDVVFLVLNDANLYFVDNHPSGDVTRGAFTYYPDEDYHLPDTVYGKPGVPLTLRFEKPWTKHELTARIGECPPPGPPTCECGVCDTLTSGVTEITSPNFPFNYEDYTYCAIYIYNATPQNVTVQLTITYFWTEECCDDVLVLVDGVHQTTFSGWQPAGTMSRYTVSAGSIMSLLFYSNDQLNFLGFSLLVDIQTDNTVVPKCCPAGYDFIEDLPDCYRVERGQGKVEGTDRLGAKISCENDEGALFKWETCYEFETVRKFLDSTDNASVEKEKYYVQGDREVEKSDPLINTPWYWFDTSEIDLAPLPDCTFWGAAEPNNHKSYKREELCLNMPELRGYKLNDCWCTRKIGFVCKHAALTGNDCS